MKVNTWQYLGCDASADNVLEHRACQQLSGLFVSVKTHLSRMKCVISDVILQLLTAIKRSACVQVAK